MSVLSCELLAAGYLIVDSPQALGVSRLREQLSVVLCNVPEPERIVREWSRSSGPVFHEMGDPPVTPRTSPLT